MQEKEIIADKRSYQEMGVPVPTQPTLGKSCGPQFHHSSKKGLQQVIS